MSEPEREERCERCRFWEFIKNDEGWCNRFPPSIPHTAGQEETTTLGYSMYMGLWPVTVSTSWCGEFQPRK